MRAKLIAATLVGAAALGVGALALVSAGSSPEPREVVETLGRVSGSTDGSSTSTAVSGRPFPVRVTPSRSVEPGSVPEAYRAGYLPSGFVFEDQRRQTTEDSEIHKVVYRHTDRLAKIFVTTYASGVPSSMLPEIISGESDTFRGRPAYSNPAAIAWIDDDDVIVVVLGRGLPTEEVRRVAEDVRKGDA